MKVMELVGSAHRDSENKEYFMYYVSEIEGKKVIIQRALGQDIEELMKKRYLDQLRMKDSIRKIFVFDNEEEFNNYILKMKNTIDRIDPSEQERENQRLISENRPIMTWGKESELSLANISIDLVVNKYDELYLGNTEPSNEKEKNGLDIYKFLIEQKARECTSARLEELNKMIAAEPEFFDINTHIKAYEEMNQKKFSKEQIEKAMLLDKQMKDCIATGKYNLKDYKAFLEGIPSVLEGKKVFLIGQFGTSGRFLQREYTNFEPVSAYEIAKKFYIPLKYIYVGNSNDIRIDERIEFPSIDTKMAQYRYQNLYAFTYRTMEADNGVIGTVVIGKKEMGIRLNEEGKMEIDRFYDPSKEDDSGDER